VIVSIVPLVEKLASIQPAPTMAPPIMPSILGPSLAMTWPPKNTMVANSARKTMKGRPASVALMFSSFATGPLNTL